MMMFFEKEDEWLHDPGDVQFESSDTLLKKIRDVLLFFFICFIGMFFFLPEYLKDLFPLIGRRLRGEKERECDDQGIEIEKK